MVTREIGQKPYSYPVIRVKTLYLWPPVPEYAYPASPAGYYYPYGYYPYGFHYGLGFRYGHRF